MVYQSYVIAAFGCYYEAVHMVSDAEQEVMLAFARQAAAALQNARLFDETRRRASHLEALNAIITEVAAAPALNHLLEITLELTLRALDPRHGARQRRGHLPGGAAARLRAFLYNQIRRAGDGPWPAQAYGIIQQHEGYIDVHSLPGEGATFHFYLREQEQAEESIALPASPEEIAGQGETLLLVEEDYSTRQALLTLLEDYNYRVLAASNGVEALRIYEQHAERIDLVISDLVMPEMGGVALYQALLERWPGVRILFVTGHPLSEYEHALLADGRVHWLQKPFSVHVFNQALSNVLHESV